MATLCLTLSNRSNAILAHSNENYFNRILAALFPPTTLGRVDNTSLNYAYRMSRTAGFERNLAEVNMYVALRTYRDADGNVRPYVKEGEAKPTYVRGTRESRAARLRGEL